MTDSREALLREAAEWIANEWPNSYSEPPDLLARIDAALAQGAGEPVAEKALASEIFSFIWTKGKYPSWEAFDWLQRIAAGAAPPASPPPATEPPKRGHPENYYPADRAAQTDEQEKK